MSLESFESSRNLDYRVVQLSRLKLYTIFDRIVRESTDQQRTMLNDAGVVLPPEDIFDSFTGNQEEIFIASQQQLAELKSILVAKLSSDPNDPLSDTAWDVSQFYSNWENEVLPVTNADDTPQYPVVLKEITAFDGDMSGTVSHNKQFLITTYYNRKPSSQYIVGVEADGTFTMIQDRQLYHGEGYVLEVITEKGEVWHGEEESQGIVQRERLYRGSAEMPLIPIDRWQYEGTVYFCNSMIDHGIQQYQSARADIIKSWDTMTSLTSPTIRRGYAVTGDSNIEVSHWYFWQARQPTVAPDQDQSVTGMRITINPQKAQVITSLHRGVTAPFNESIENVVQSLRKTHSNPQIIGRYDALPDDTRSVQSIAYFPQTLTYLDGTDSVKVIFSRDTTGDRPTVLQVFVHDRPVSYAFKSNGDVAIPLAGQRVLEFSIFCAHGVWLMAPNPQEWEF